MKNGFLVFDVDTQPCFIREKADGITSYTMPINFYPFNKTIIDIDIKAEYIEEMNLYLVFDIDVIGGLNIKEKFPDQTLTIFIKPPSIDELESRLKKRNSETGSSIKMRIKKAKNEILLADKFDYIVENDILKKSYSKVFKLVNNFINE